MNCNEIIKCLSELLEGTFWGGAIYARLWLYMFSESNNQENKFFFITVSDSIFVNEIFD